MNKKDILKEKTEDSVAICQEIMEKMRAGGDPISICKEMMGKCCSQI